MRILLAIASSLLTGAPLLAGVVVEVNGTQYTTTGGIVTFGPGSVPDITIAFTTPVSTTVNIRIFDSTTIATIGHPNDDPAASIGKLTLTGSATSAGRVNLLIADGDQAFPSDTLTAQQLRPGVVNFGSTSLGTETYLPSDVSHDYDAHPWSSSNTPPLGSNFPATGFIGSGMTGLVIPDPSLRRQTVLAAVVLGNICPGWAPGNINPKNGHTLYECGRIECGQIMRLAAGRTSSEGVITGGNILAHVRAVARDRFLSYDLCNPPTAESPQFTFSHAIESITAANQIMGDIVAQGRMRGDPNGTVDTPGALYERSPDITRYGTPDDPWVEPPPCGWNATTFHPGYYPAWIDRGSIFSVRLGPSERAAGIYGDIVSTLGRISSIRSTGEIVASKIEAADGVLEVRIHKWDAAADADKIPLAKNLSVANITASSGSSVQRLGNDTGDDYATTIAKASNQGCIHLVETKGEFSGTVTCENLIDAGDGSQRDSRGRSGIIVWSNPDQVQPLELPGPTITVNHLAHNVCMLAPTFGAIHVGWQLKGTIDAFGWKRYPPSETLTGASLAPLTGGVVLSGLSIGDSARFNDAVSRDKYHGMVPGFVGGYRPPVDLNPSISGGAVDPTLPPQMFDARFPTEFVNAAGVHQQVGGEPIINHVHAMLWDPDRYLWVSPVGGSGHPSQYDLDQGALDSVIRAENGLPTKSQIFAMHQRIFENEEPKNTIVAWYRPRIEGPVMQELGIPDITPLSPLAPYYRYAGIFEGVVWSGAVEYLPFSPFSVWEWHGSVRARYPNIKSNAMVQRVGPGGDVWGRGLSLRVVRDMCGELHTTSIDLGTDAATPSHGVDIGSRLGDLTTWPYPSFANRVNDTSPPALEYTPRDRARVGPAEFEADIAPRGAVYVGLHEHQVVDSEPFDPALYNNVPRLEQTAGILANTSYNSDLTSELSLWDPLDPAHPVYNNPSAAWTGFVRVGDPWIDAGRVYTLGKSGAIGTTPLPDTTWDVMDLPGFVDQYRRHSWDLSGFLYRNEAKLGGAVGIPPYHLHVDDSAPELTDYAHPDNPYNYTLLSTSEWADRWSLDHTSSSDPTFIRSIRLRFYGPLTETHPTVPTDSTRDLPVTIWEMGNSGGVHTWHKLDLRDMSTGSTGNNFFDYRIEWNDLYIGPRCGQAIRNGVYKVTLHDPVSDAAEGRSPTNYLHCKSFFLNDLEYEPAPFTWYFRLFHNCADLGIAGGLPGSDGLFDNNDFIAFINLYYAQDPRADVGVAGGLPGSDGMYDNNDFIAFINLFFEAEPCRTFYNVLDCP